MLPCSMAQIFGLVERSGSGEVKNNVCQSRRTSDVFGRAILFTKTTPGSNGNGWQSSIGEATQRSIASFTETVSFFHAPTTCLRPSRPRFLASNLS